MTNVEFLNKINKLPYYIFKQRNSSHWKTLSPYKTKFFLQVITVWCFWKCVLSAWVYFRCLVSGCPVLSLTWVWLWAALVFFLVFERNAKEHARGKMAWRLGREGMIASYVPEGVSSLVLFQVTLDRLGNSRATGKSRFFTQSLLSKTERKHDNPALRPSLAISLAVVLNPSKAAHGAFLSEQTQHE